MKKLLVFILFGIPVILWEAYVVQLLYKWFIINTFNLPSLNLFQIIGILVLISIIKYTHKEISEEISIKEYILAMMQTALLYALSLGFGYIAYLLT